MVKYAWMLLVTTFIIGCNEGPNELSPTNSNQQKTEESAPNSLDSKGDAEGNTPQPDVHEVVVVEVLPTSKYVYLRVKELDQEYWIATLKTEVTVGETYYYTGGLVKENFESKEHNRIFDQMILVQNIVARNHGHQQEEINLEPLPEGKAGEIQIRENGTVSIADVVNHASSFVDKRLKIQGTCTKVNNNIMGTNWLHIDDGTNNGFDFVATTKHNIAVGDKVVLGGILSANKDFGAGYKYALLLEDCDLIQ